MFNYISFNTVRNYVGVHKIPNLRDHFDIFKLMYFTGLLFTTTVVFSFHFPIFVIHCQYGIQTQTLIDRKSVV